MNDHDLLIQINAKLDAHFAESQRRWDDHATQFKEHVDKDEQSFEKINDRTRTLERRFWIAYGAGLMLIAAVKFVFK